jgi:class 3 adenylate cyclase
MLRVPKMKCPKCQTENPETIEFCGECGAKLERICPHCNFANPAEFRFCGKCGQNLYSPELAPKKLSYDEILAKIQRYLPKDLTQKILAQRDKIEGEQKQVTVMYCDMEGFTSLTEKLGLEETYSLMDKVYEILIHKVNDYEGTVNDLTGDGLMALFGSPIALEDAPQKAILSAFAIHREMAKFSNKMTAEGKILAVKMRIGIHTGPVVVGTLGNDLRVQFTAVGDTVNLASRIEELAEPGTTYVTDDTYKLTRALFHFEALGEKEVKGKKLPVAVYKLVSAIQDVYRPRLGSERMIYSEMVGRDNELHKLELQVMKAINGQGSIVNIIGEAGIGKSRLVAELKKREMMKAVKLLEGRAISIGGNLSFHPITDLLKQWMGIRQDEDQLEALSKLQNVLRNLFPEDFGEVLPFVATLMGIPLLGKYAERVKGLEGEALQKLILKSLRDLLIRAAERTPLMIVVEDLHWADTSSLELLESLFRLAETQRILFVNLLRPGFPETADRILRNLKERLPVNHLEIVEMVLEPLDERMSEVLIGNMLTIW